MKIFITGEAPELAWVLQKNIWNKNMKLLFVEEVRKKSKIAREVSGIENL